MHTCTMKHLSLNGYIMPFCKNKLGMAWGQNVILLPISLGFVLEHREFKPYGFSKNSASCLDQRR